MMLETVSGHRPLAGKGRLGMYLEFEKGPDGSRSPEWGVRALATDLLNVCDLRKSGGPTWYENMDDTRATAGNDRPVRGKRPLTYKQYIMSPDPKDDCSLATLRECATEWARKWFSDYEVAIVYHDDNENGIIHAHIVVNNTNLETGRRLGPYLTARRVKDMNRSCQRIALEHGLSAFDKDHVSRSAVELADRDPASEAPEREARDPVRDRPARAGGGCDTKGGDAAYARPRSMAERTMRAEGKRTWKMELADVLDAALSVSGSEGEFIASCILLGLRVTESVAAVVAGGLPELLFSFAGRGRAVRGSTLAPRFSRARLTLRFAEVYGELGRATVAYVCGTVPASRSRRAAVIRSTALVAHGYREAPVPLADFVEMTRFNAAHSIVSYDDYARVGGARAARMERVARAAHVFDPKALETAGATLDRDMADVAGRMSAAAAARAAQAKARAAQQEARREAGGRGDAPANGQER